MEKTVPKTLINVHSDDWLPHSSLFADSYSRGFISESGIVFGFVQRDPKHHDLLSPGEMTKASRQYRSVIHSWFLKTLAAMSSPGQNETLDPEEREQLLEQSQMLHKMEIAWHLCEILYINVPSLGTLFVPLLDWIKWHFTQYVELAEQIIAHDPPEMHQNYWDVIMFFALRGDTENAALFLELHPESKIDQAFVVVKELLKKFPVVSNAIAVHEYYLRWEYWRETVGQTISQERVPPGPKKSHAQLNLLLHLLAGEEDAFHKVRHLFHSWYQMFVSYLLFTNPCLKKDIDDYLDEFLTKFYPREPMSPFDRLIRSSFTFDLIEVIKQSSMCFDDSWWFVTHFVDLIHNSSRYSEYKITDMAFIRDSFVISYAESLFAKRKQFWQLGIEYLVHCKDSQQHILTCLERVPFDNDRELQRLLTTARRFNFTELEYSLCRIRARQWIKVAANPAKQQKYGSALFWAILSRDKTLINHIVDQFLRNYLHQVEKYDAEQKLALEKTTRPRLLDEDILANIGGSIVLSERLIFLCKYHEFHQLCDRNEFREAAKILVDMLISGAVPDFFWLQILRDCLPLIQKSAAATTVADIFVDGQQTCKIIASLEQILARMKQKNGHRKTVRAEWAEYFNCKSTDKTKKNNSGSHNNHDHDHGETNKATIQKQQQQGDHHQQDEEQLSLELERLEILEKKIRMAAAHNLGKNFVRADDESLMFQ